MRVWIRFVALLLLLVTTALLYDRWMVRDRLASLTPIDPMPHTRELIAAERFAEAETYLGYFVAHRSPAVTPQARELLEAIRAKRQSWSHRAKLFFNGALHGRSDAVAGMVGAGLADLFVVGDLRDVWIEGRHWAAGRKVDEVVLALATLGIAATAATFGTAGGAGSIKESLSLLKQMRKTKYLPSWLVRALMRLPKSAHIQRDANALLVPIITLYRQGGLQATRVMLRESKSLKALKKMEFFAQRFKQESAVLLRIDPASLRLARSVPPRTIVRTSLYGKPGFKLLARRVKYTARLSKIVSKQYQGWLRIIPLWGLLVAWGIALYGLLPRLRFGRSKP